jgi:hypothetical protein
MARCRFATEQAAPFDLIGTGCYKNSSSGGAVAQLEARLDGIEEVRGSNPLGSTSFISRSFRIARNRSVQHPFANTPPSGENSLYAGNIPAVSVSILSGSFRSVVDTVAQSEGLAGWFYNGGERWLVCLTWQAS